MKKIYLFNSDHDLALGNHDVNYMAPKSAKKMMADLAMLPMWYADAGSLVLANAKADAVFLEEKKKCFNLDVNVITYAQLPDCTFGMLFPWGWNRALYNKMVLAGVPNSALIDYDYIDVLRNLSHRSTSVKLLQALPKSIDLCGFSFSTSHVDDIQNIASRLGPIVLKAPLSGSGKGLRWCIGEVDKPLLNWARRILKAQDSVIVEPIFNKVEDLAMEFYIKDDKTIDFIGYSSFHTHINGAYSGNRLIGDEEFEEELDYKYFTHGFLARTRAVLEPMLLHTYGKDYQGCLGVDMMICKFDTVPYYRLHPCVEVNVRMNMGIVAHKFFNRYVDNAKQGLFKVAYFKSTEQLLEHVASYSKEYPLTIQEGKIIKGFFTLTPITSDTQYLAWALIE